MDRYGITWDFFCNRSSFKGGKVPGSLLLCSMRNEQGGINNVVCFFIACESHIADAKIMRSVA